MNIEDVCTRGSNEVALKEFWVGKLGLMVSRVMGLTVCLGSCRVEKSARAVK